MPKTSLKKLLPYLIILGTLSIFPSQTFASTVTPTTINYIVNQEDFKFDNIKYKNDTAKEETIKLSVSSYNAKESSNLTDKPFLALEESQYTVKPKQEITIPILSSIPKETPVGTYFNVIYIQKKETKKGDGNVSVTPSIGVLVSFHVQNSTSTISKIFFDQSDITVKVTKKGLPYIQPTEFEYTYKNNSNFVFKPEGEIRILDQNGNQILQRFEINTEKKAIYPGESITQTYSVNLWGDVKSVLGTKNIVSKTYSDLDATPVLNKVQVSILYQTVILAGIAVVLVLSMITLIISIFLKPKTKKQKEIRNEEIKVLESE